MYRPSTSHKFILAVADKVTNYLITMPLYRGISHKVREAHINHVFCKYGPLSDLIFDKNQCFLSSVMQYIYKRLGVKMNTVSSYNHDSLRTE